MKKQLLTIMLFLVVVFSATAQTQWTVGMSAAQTRQVVNNIYNLLNANKADKTNPTIIGLIKKSNGTSVTDTAAMLSDVRNLAGSGGSAGVDAKLINYDDTSRNASPKISDIQISNILVSASNPSTGNIYINSVDSLIHYKIGNTWIPVLKGTPSSGGGGTSQNLLYYSEQIDNSTFWTVSGTTVTANQANDLAGNLTMEKITLTSVYGYVKQEISGLSANTTYRISFDCKTGTQGSEHEMSVADVSNGGANIIDQYYTISSTVSRVYYDFTTPAGCTTIGVWFLNAAIGDNWYIGRVQVAAPSKTYVTTTSSPVL